MTRARWRICFIACCLLISVSTVNAATPIPAADDVAAAHFPAAEAFGSDWMELHRTSIELPADLFREGVAAIYGGPAGARVMVAVLISTRDRVAVRRSWEEAVSIFDSYRGELEHADSRADDLATLPPPPGCAEAKRIDGTARQLAIDTSIPMGITLCAAEPDLIVLALVSGSVLDETGYVASDLAATLVLGTSEATPAGG